MTTLELSGLEYQVDHLLHALERIKTENTSLRQKLSNSIRERSLLIEKNRKVVTKIKQTVAQLKEDMS